MNLRNKTLLAIGITFMCVLVFALVIAVPMTMSGLNRLEFLEGEEGVLQTKSAIDSEMNSLQGTAQDWSWWDDMDLFVQSENPGFEVDNLNTASIANIRANILILRNTSGTIVYTRSLSRDFSKEVSSPDETFLLITTSPLASSVTNGAEAKTGLIMLPEGPMMVAFSPILHTSTEGPSHGTLIIGRYLESGVLSRVSGVVGYPVRVVRARDTDIQPLDPATALPEPGGSGIFVRPVNESVVNGVLPLMDINGEKIFIITEMPRTTYHSGLAIVSEFFILFLLAAIATLVVVAYVLDRTVLQPLDRLNSQIRMYKVAGGEMPVRVVTGDDELAQLEDAIRTSHRDLMESEKRFRQIIETAQEGICTLGHDGIITFANEQLASMLGYSPDDLVGKPYVNFMPPADQNIQEDHIIKTRQGLSDQYEARLIKKDGSLIWALISTTPVIAGKVITGSFAMITDITERKLTENALQQATRKLNLLNAVTFNDISTALFSLSGYMELERGQMDREKIQQMREKEKILVRRITDTLNFANNYQSLGLKAPVWQNVQRSFLLGISHLDAVQIHRRLEVENLEIFADPLLENVFLALMENVMVHAPAATDIALTCREIPEGLLLVFEDNGCGVPVGLKEKIFERRSEKKKGLGLYLVQEILGITGINIRETGDPGRGARFEILVPRGTYRFVRK